MTNEQLIAKFNPANGANMTAEDLELLRALTDEQIDVLANAYPNTPTRRSYLRLYDKNLAPDKQLYQMSTWQNLRNVRKFSNRKSLIAYDFFTTTAKFTQQVRAQQKAGNKTAAPQKVVVDMSAKEAAEELKNLVDKKGPAEKKTAEPKTPKAPAANKNTAGKAQKAADLKSVDKSAIPADQDFTDGTDKAAE